MITLSQIEGMLEEIRKSAAIGLDGEAHNTRDRLYSEVLHSIAEPMVSLMYAPVLAKKALEAEQIEFKEWYE